MADYDGFDPSDFPEYWFYGEIGPIRSTPYGSEQIGKRLIRRVDKKLATRRLHRTDEEPADHPAGEGENGRD